MTTIKHCHGYVLVSPKGQVLPETFSTDHEYACVNAYAWLASEGEGTWADAYYKKWDEFIRERQRRGWFVRECNLRLLDGA